MSQDYVSITWDLGSNTAFSAQPVDYPSPTLLSFASMQENVPVYQGTFRLSRGIAIKPDY
jgi:hypothetical protein